MVAVVGFRLTLGENEVVLLDETIKGVLGKIVDVAGGSKGCQGSKTESVLHCERIRCVWWSSKKMDSSQEYLWGEEERWCWWSVRSAKDKYRAR
jgi:hypothetical protein